MGNVEFGMISDIRFNRPINIDNDYICPGGYAMTMAGKDVHFDFEQYEGWVDENDPTILHVEQKYPDEDVMEDNEYPITEAMLSKVTEISEFFVYTGERNETDLKPISVESIMFVLSDKKYKQIYIKEEVLKTAAVCSELG
jgi:hypothetical protein